MNLMNSHEGKKTKWIEMEWNTITFTHTHTHAHLQIYSNDKQLSVIWTNPMHFLSLCWSTFAWIPFSSFEKVYPIDNGDAAVWWCRFCMFISIDLSNVLWCIVLQHTRRERIQHHHHHLKHYVNSHATMIKANQIRTDNGWICINMCGNQNEAYPF